MQEKYTRQQKQEAQGWKYGTVQEFLGLSDEEALLIEEAAYRKKRPFITTPSLPKSTILGQEDS